MNSAAYRYQIWEHKKSIINYYCVVICLVIALLISALGIMNNDNSHGAVNFNGLDISTMIFLLILSRFTFKSSFGMMLQNGISRLSLFKSRIITMLSISFLMAVIDNVLLSTTNLFSSAFKGSIAIYSLFDELYSSFQGIPIIMVLLKFMFCFFQYFTFMAGGMFLAILFYRIGRAAKIAICGGVAVLLFIILPLIDLNFTNGMITSALWNLLDFMYGASAVNPLHSYITGILLIIILSAASWLLLRRAVVQDND